MTEDIRERLIRRRHIDAEGHWMWTGAKDTYGYGRIGTGSRPCRRNRTVHRVAYEVFVGPIPDGMQIDHLCRVRLCFNPAHMEVVTQFVNTQRGLAGVFNACKTECPQGHPYDVLNTYTGSTGKRGCRKCRTEASRRYEQKRAAA